ncbi:Zinc finger C2H2-type [Trinorchestia longiramus]|nr:Zinc finger C2H2-type [Trinorchestia longiramus]
MEVWGDTTTNFHGSGSWTTQRLITAPCRDSARDPPKNVVGHKSGRAAKALRKEYSVVALKTHNEVDHSVVKADDEDLDIIELNSSPVNCPSTSSSNLPQILDKPTEAHSSNFSSNSSAANLSVTHSSSLSSDFFDVDSAVVLSDSSISNLFQNFGPDHFNVADNNDGSMDNFTTLPTNAGRSSLECPGPSDQLRYVCQFCIRKFSRLSNLKRHLLLHTGTKPFQCLYCEYRAAQKANVVQHMANRHKQQITSLLTSNVLDGALVPMAPDADLKRYAAQCHTMHDLVDNFQMLWEPSTDASLQDLFNYPQPACDVTRQGSADGAISLEDDIVVQQTFCETTNKLVKTFCCPVCGAQMRHRNNMRKHIRTHTGEKPFACRHCPFTAARKDSLMRHLSVHHWHMELRDLV